MMNTYDKETFFIKFSIFWCKNDIPKKKIMSLKLHLPVVKFAHVIFLLILNKLFREQQ